MDIEGPGEQFTGHQISLLPGGISASRKDLPGQQFHGYTPLGGLSSLAPLLNTVVDMDVVVRGLSFPWAPGSSPGFAAVRRAFCQAVAALPGRTLKYTGSHRRPGF